MSYVRARRQHMICSCCCVARGRSHRKPLVGGSVALESVDRRLVRRDDRLILLLDPPFDTSDLDPGCIKGYVPGVRENGGQYTHSAIWTVMAMAAMGDYRVEPHVVAADIYGVDPHTGHGGWTWYTGSAGWMYRLIVESLLGLHLEVNKLRLTPCLPADWTTFQIHYR